MHTLSGYELENWVPLLIFYLMYTGGRFMHADGSSMHCHDVYVQFG